MSNLSNQIELTTAITVEDSPNVHFGYGPHSTLSAAVTWVKSKYKSSATIKKGFTIAVEDGGLKEYWLTSDAVVSSIATTNFVAKGGAASDIVTTTLTSFTAPETGKVYLITD